MMGKTARNETKKLEATYINNIAISFFVAGLVLPALALMQEAAVGNIWAPKTLGYLAAMIGGIILSVYIHFGARKVLTSLED
jgi:hypothetical protein